MQYMNDFTLLDPQRLAWLLHTNLREGKSASARLPATFRQWWLIHRGLNYQPWPAGAPQEYEQLLRPLPGKPRVGPFALNQTLKLLLAQRPDLEQIFDIKTPTGYTALIAWFYTHGLREYGLQEQVPPQQLAWLDSEALAPVELQGDLQQPLTWLMYFVWLGSPGLQVAFPLTSAMEQRAYLWWFLFNGVSGSGLAPLMAPRWYAWLHEKRPVRPGAQLSVPRAALMLWGYRADLRQAFDLREAVGVGRLLDWFATAVEQEESLRWLRPAVTQAQVSASSPPVVRKARPFGLNLIGFAFGQLGIGEDVRMAVAACEAAGIAFKVVNVHPGNVGVGDQALAAHVGAGEGHELAPYAINVFCLTGFDTLRVFLERGPSLFEGRYNIGWWPWELPVWPKEWDVVFGLMDEIWAATTFTESMYRAAAQRAARSGTLVGLPKGTRIAEVPITLMPMPASIVRVKKMTRKALKLPEKRFLFLYVFDFNSYLDRKNPFAAVEAFRRAFAPRDHSAGLVLKTMNSNPRNPAWRRFLKACAADPRIMVIDYTLERGEVLGLIRSCDAYVSLHRSEGFGRTLAEAQLFGKPVVGTDFSGNVDFLTPEMGFPVRWKKRAVKLGAYPFVTAADQPWWAEPDVDHAAQQMRAARKASGDPAFGKRVLRFAQKHFSEARVGELLRQRLAQIRERL
jgi:glycosyltransferase involved in cell wall biosynthesis